MFLRLATLFFSIVLSACASSRETAPETGGQGARLANPAATWCVEQGGRHVVKKGPDGSENGFCLLGGREYPEWDFFHGEAGPGIEAVPLAAGQAGPARAARPMEARLRPDRTSPVVATLPAGALLRVIACVRRDGALWTRVLVSLGSYEAKGWLPGAPGVVTIP